MHNALHNRMHKGSSPDALRVVFAMQTMESVGFARLARPMQNDPHMAKKSAKLSIKKETLRTLNSLNDDQLRAVAGGTLYAVSGECGGGIISSVSTSREPTFDATLQNNYVKRY